MKLRGPGSMQPRRRVAQRAGPPSVVDLVQRGHQPLRTFPIVLIKQIGLNLTGRDKPGQQDSRFLIFIPLSIELSNALKRQTNQFRRAGGGHRKFPRQSIAVVRSRLEGVSGEKDREICGGESFSAQLFSGAGDIHGDGFFHLREGGNRGAE